MKSLHALRAALIAGVAFFSHSTQAATHRVALATFTSAENTWAGQQTRATLASALPAAIGQAPGVEWVPLAALSHEQQAVAAFATSLKAARTARADWMITGRFGPRELVLEAIDLAHADVLAEQHLAATKRLPDLAAGVRALLEAAAKRESAVVGQPTLAVLIGPEVEGLERAFEAALAEAQLATQPYRLIRFPRASLGTEETYHMLADFAEDAGGAWHSIADAYLWATLPKRADNLEESAGAHTPEIALNAWDGRRAPLCFVEESEPVDRAQLPEALRGQARRLAESVAEYLRQARPGAPDEAQRARIARSPVMAAESLLTHNAGSLQTVAARRQFLNIVQTLEAACFFDPQSAVAMEQLTRARWDSRLSGYTKNPGRFALARHEAWGRYAGRFGLKAGAPSKSDLMEAFLRKHSSDSDELHRLMEPGFDSGDKLAREFLSSAQAALSDPEYPDGIPAEEKPAWADRLARELARRTVMVAEDKATSPMGGLPLIFKQNEDGAFLLRDAKYRIEVLEKVWPALTDSARQYTPLPLREAITLSYAQAGRPGGEAPLLATLPPPPPPRPRPSGLPPPRGIPPPTNPMGEIVRGDLFDYQPFSMPAPELKAPLASPEGLGKLQIQLVRQMVPLAGKLWLIAEAPAEMPAAVSNTRLLEEFRPVGETVKRLYACDAATGATHRVEAAARLVAWSLFAHEGRLWISFRKEGVAVLDPKNETLRRFGKEEGLKDSEGWNFAAAGGKLFVTGASMDLYEFDAATEHWMAHPLGPKEDQGTRYAGLSRDVAGHGPWLLLTEGPMSLEELRTGSWKPLHEMKALGAPIWVRGRTGAVTADASGFWIDAGWALCHLDPAAGRLTAELPVDNPLAFRRWVTVRDAVEALARQRAALRPEAAALPPWQEAGVLCGPIESLLADGDYLWVTSRLAGPRSPSRLLLWHMPTRQWVGQYPAGFSPSLAVDGKYVWLAAAANGSSSEAQQSTGQLVERTSTVPSAGASEAQLRRVEKRLVYTVPKKKPAAPSEKEARAAYERLSVRDQAFNSFARGRYAEAAALFAQVPPDKLPDLRGDTAPEALFMQALCYDAQGLAQPAKQRALLESLRKRFPGDSLAEPARQQLAALPPP